LEGREWAIGNVALTETEQEHRSSRVGGFRYGPRLEHDPRSLLVVRSHANDTELSLRDLVGHLTSPTPALSDVLRDERFDDSRQPSLEVTREGS
jgi:hypothetical protein